MRFINDDVKLKVGGRTAVSISKEELEEMMLKVAQRHNDELADAELPLEEMDLYYVVQTLHHWAVNKDNKFNVDGENVIVPDDEYDNDEFEDIGESLLGFHTLQNGLTFFGYMAGGDWESPVFMIIYYDGKKLRGYTPSYGNAVHLDCKCAFGSGSREMDEIPAYRKKYGNCNAWKEPKTDWEIQDVLRNCYLEKYDMYPREDNYIPVNFDAMKQDIESRIVVVGASSSPKKQESRFKKYPYRFINDDQEVKAGGRKAANISIDDLLHIMYERALSLASTPAIKRIGSVDDAKSGRALVEMVDVLHRNDATIKLDNVCDIGCDTICAPGFEEYEDESNGKFGEHLCGWHTLSNGLSFFGYVSAEDGVFDAFNIIYFDGEYLRMYTPIRGNLIDMFTKSALGCGYLDDEQYEKMRKKYEKAGVNLEEYEDMDEAWAAYPAMYGVAMEDIFYHWDAIREDIETHIVVDKKLRQNPVPSDKPFSAPTSSQETNGYNNLPSALVGMLILFGEFMERCKINPDKKVTLKLPLSNGACSYLSREKDNKLYLTGFVPEELRPTVDEAGKIISAEAKVIMAAFSEIIVDFEIIVE